MITPETTLLCIFSYNMGAALQRCLDSIADMCPDFKVAISDDNSDDPVTLAVIEKNRDRLYEAFTNSGSKQGKRHGNLYQNIQTMMDFAWERGFRYLFMLQDDMQFVRPFSFEVRQQYSDIFADEAVIQIDPRFLRYASSYEVVPGKRGYRHGPDTAYADVGIVDLARLRKLGWRMQEGERCNQRELAALGKMRVFPFTPIAMHVPFPKLYRNGKRRIRGFPFHRGRYHWHYMTEAEMQAMDARPLEQPPFFRRFLRPKNMRLSWFLYAARRKDTKLFT
jgi:glycosyltransferase involved in cell wall biosynthesis